MAAVVTAVPDDAVLAVLSPSSSPPTSSAHPASRPKRRRNAALDTECCRTCRLRKVKCTGNPGNGPCSNCLRLEYTCDFGRVENAVTQDIKKLSRTTPSQSHTEAGTPRKRAQRACKECHTHKTKCSGDLPKCKRCAVGDLVCVYLPARRKFSNVAFQADASVEPASTGENGTHGNPVRAQSVGYASAAELQSRYFTAEHLLLNRDVVLQHVDSYFRLLQTVPGLGFLHRRTTYKELEDGTFSPVVAAAICAVTAVILSPGQPGRSFARQCKDRVDFHIFCNRESIERGSLLLLAFCIIYDWVLGQHGKVYRERADAADLLILLNLNWDDTSGSWIEQECTRRLVWFIFVFDRFLAGGFDYLIKCPDSMMKLRLPCDETSFQNNQPVVMERLDHRATVPNGPLLPPMPAFYIRLMQIRHQILGKTKSFMIGFSPHPNRPRLKVSQIMQDVLYLRKKLVDLNAALPETFKDSDINIKRHLGTPDWTPFVMFHTWLYTLYTDLHRFSLPGIRERAAHELLAMFTTDFIQSSRKQAVGYAVSLARFWQRLRLHVANRGPGGESLVTADFMAMTCLSQSTKLLIVARQYRLYHGLQQSTAPLRTDTDLDDDEIAVLMESNMAALSEYQRILPEYITKTYRELRRSIDDYQVNPDLTQLGWLGVARPEEIGSLRLPGPLFILEGALIGRDTVNEPETSATSSLADKLLQDRGKPTQEGDSGFYTAPLFDNDSGPPGIPAALGRAREALKPVQDLDLVRIVQDQFYPLSMEADHMMGMMPDGFAPIPECTMPPGPTLQPMPVMEHIPSQQQLVPMAGSGDLPQFVLNPQHTDMAFSQYVPYMDQATDQKYQMNHRVYG